MKQCRSLFLACSLLAIVSACADDSSESTSQCDNSYIPTCTADKTGYSVCEQGIIKVVECGVGLACDPSDNICKSSSSPKQPSCDANTPRTCLADNSGFTVCENGALVEKKCPSSQVCDPTLAMCMTPSQEAQCTPQTHPQTCNAAGTGFTACIGGVVKETLCPSGQTCDKASNLCHIDESNPQQSQCDEKTYPATCPTPHTLQYCSGGKIITETCKSGAVCNAAIKNKSCKIPNFGDLCSPDTFAETCIEHDSVALYCNEETGKVDTLDCKKAYGDGYRCDIAFDFNGKDYDLAICISNREKCKTPGNITSECEYDPVEDEHFTTYETCYDFATGAYKFVSDVVSCDHKGCSSDKTECKD